MKRRILSVLLVLALVLPLLPLPAAAADFSGGKGTLEDPYLIKTAADLRAVAPVTDANVHYRLESDINMNGGSTGIGTFTGTLDGKGFTITGLNGCLVKSLASGAVIRDLTIASSTIDAPKSLGNTGNYQREIVVRDDPLTYQNYMNDAASADSTRFLPANLGFAAGENYGTLDNITVKNSAINGYYQNGNAYIWSNSPSNVNSFYYGLANYAPGNLGGVTGLNRQSGKVLNCTVQDLTVVSDNAAGIIGGVAGRSSGTVLGSVVTGMKIAPKDGFRNWSAPKKTGEDGDYYDYENCTETVPYTWAVGGAVGLYDRTLSHAACSYTGSNTGNYNNGGVIPAIGYTVLEPDHENVKRYTCNNVDSFNAETWNGWLNAAGPDGKTYESLGLRGRENDMTVKANASAADQVQVTLLDDNGNLLGTETFARVTCTRSKRRSSARGRTITSIRPTWTGSRSRRTAARAAPPPAIRSRWTPAPRSGGPTRPSPIWP